MNISEPFIRRPIATSLLSIALLLAGVVAYRTLPVASLPQVEFPVIQQFAHEVETLLDLARNSKLPVDSALIDIILQSGDFMSQCVNDVGQVVGDSSTADGRSPELQGLDDTTGRVLWAIPRAALCGLSNNQMLLSTNEDLAVVDIHTHRR